jgi:hypothetical protein
MVKQNNSPPEEKKPRAVAATGRECEGQFLQKHTPAKTAKQISGREDVPWKS